MRRRIELEAALGYPTLISVAGINIGFNIYLISEARIENLMITFPEPIHYYRERRATLRAHGNISSSLPYYTKFGSDGLKFQTTEDQNFANWTDAVSGGSVEFAAIQNFGILVDVSFGPVHAEPTLGLEIGTKLGFTLDKEKCRLPYVKGSAETFFNCCYSFNPWQIIQFLMYIVFGRWYLVVMGTTQIVCKTANWLANNSPWIGSIARSFAGPFAIVVDFLASNSRGNYRLWTSSLFDECLF
jgi:hypothetical protein